MRQQNQRQSLRQNQFVTLVRKIIRKAAKEKMLPNIIRTVSKEFNLRSDEDYQKQAKLEYIEHLRTPVKYNPEQSRSEHEKMLEKISKAKRNQLQVDYLQLVKEGNRSVPKFQDCDLESRKIEPRKQFTIFKLFDQKMFKCSTAQIFDDKLQIDFNQMYQVKTEEAECCHHFSQTEGSRMKEILQYSPNKEMSFKLRPESLVFRNQITTKVTVDGAKQVPLGLKRRNKFIANQKQPLPFWIEDKDLYQFTAQIDQVIIPNEVSFLIQKLQSEKNVTIFQAKWTHQVAQKGSKLPNAPTGEINFQLAENRKDYCLSFSLLDQGTRTYVGKVPMAVFPDERSKGILAKRKPKQSPSQTELDYYSFDFVAGVKEAQSKEEPGTVVAVIRTHTKRISQLK